MRASYFTEFRKDQQLPVVDFDPTMNITPSAMGYVGLQYRSMDPSVPSGEEWTTYTAVIDLDTLHHIRAHMGKIWAIKYVRSATISVDSPYGCSLLTAKTFVEEFCPAEQYLIVDENRSIREKLWIEYERKRTREEDSRD